MSRSFSVEGQWVDIKGKRIVPARVTVSDGLIEAITPINTAPLQYIMPGFIDAHVHIESSLLTPAGFARLAVCHGTVGTVSDPHEIANVLGMQGVKFMLESAAKVPFHFFFGAPSCVPATEFETAGASLSEAEVDDLLQRSDIYYLSEMMNYPGVIRRNDGVMQKIASAHRVNKPVDGHAPGLIGKDLDDYLSAGISTDHECFSYDEALEKLTKGMKVIIREGSAARNFEALHPLISAWSHRLMFCSDDKHPDTLLLGHINQLVARAVGLGYDVFDVLAMACLNPVEHYKLPIGTLKPGDSADFIVVNNLEEFLPVRTFIQGELVASEGESLLPHLPEIAINQFRDLRVEPKEIALPEKESYPVIVCLDGQLITERLLAEPSQIGPENDILKLVVVNRYRPAKPAVALIKNFGLKQGAIASSVAHDSHNLIAVGTSDEEICKALNLLAFHKGGLSACSQAVSHVLPLPVAGLMSNSNAFEVAREYAQIDAFSKSELGSTLKAPFMSLSFMALLVIPHLKLSDKGLFDGDTFSFVT